MNPRPIGRAPRLFVVALLLFFSLFTVSLVRVVQADTFVGGTDSWTMVGTPTQARAFQEGLFVTYHSNLAFPTQGVIIMVLHNTLGQTVYYSTATISLGASSTSMAFLVEAGLPSGSYNASVFAFTFGGVALSTSTTQVFSF